MESVKNTVGTSARKARVEDGRIVTDANISVGVLLFGDAVIAYWAMSVQ